MKLISAVLFALTMLTGCNTPVNVSVLPQKKIVPPLYSGIKNFDVLSTANNCYRGSQPLDKKDFEFLKSIGVQIILKLDTDKEGSDAEAEMLGMQVVKIPISFSEQLFGNVPSRQIQEFILSHKRNLYIHCAHGQDRTGLACMMYNMDYNNMTKQQAVKDMLSHGFHKILHGLWESAENY